ncbi:MAG TPA: hypothetical protein VMS40_09595 [Vicinamibacterales bacterium]|nr:hypothetical protein [Vicinamibacterales bacterium]
MAFAAVLGATALGQVNLPAESIGGPLSSQPVLEAPFSADATTTVHAILDGGTRLDQTTTDRYYRDSTGRVRIERHMEGLPAPKTRSERHIRTVVAPDPSRWPGVFTVDDQTGTTALSPRAIMANTAGGNHSFDVPVGGVRFLTFFRAGDLLSADPGAFGDVRDEPLGTKRIAGVETTGRRITIVVPPGYGRNDRWIEMVDERWESVELQLLIQSRQSDPRSTIEYGVSNIRRTEPPAHLFELPTYYTENAILSSVNEPAMSFMSAESPRAGAFIAGKMR